MRFHNNRGGFFGPIAFLTATQQTAAAALGMVQDCNSGPLPLRMSSKNFPVCVLDHKGAALELLEMVIDVIPEGECAAGPLS
eukprot:SAG22_NODE_657_length_8082_cov_7.277590_2_plen_82_part_00